MRPRDVINMRVDGAENPGPIVSFEQKEENLDNKFLNI